MELRFREAALEDFEPFYEACFFQYRGGAVVEATVRHEWTVFLENGAALSMVVEDAERPAGRRIVGCAQIVFVTDEFTAWMKAVTRPNLITQASHPMPDGSRPLLTLPQVAQANAGAGLNGAFTRWGRADGLLTPEESLAVGRYMHDAFAALTRGYQFKELLSQAYTPPARELGLHAGFLDRSCDDDCHARGQPCRSTSFLMGITREEARAREGCVMGHYFIYSRPRFGFNLREQEMLCLCQRMPEATNKSLAQTLDVPLNTVKNWWLSIYGRVTDAAPDLLPLPEAEGARGPEKRRRLLQYLREHPEELRPYKPPRRKAGF